MCYVAWPSGEAVLTGQERLPSASPADFSCHWRSKHLSKKGAQSDDQAKKDGPLCLLIDCWDLSKISVDIMVNVMQQTKKKVQGESSCSLYEDKMKDSFRRQQAKELLAQRWKLSSLSWNVKGCVNHKVGRAHHQSACTPSFSSFSVRSRIQRNSVAFGQ